MKNFSDNKPSVTTLPRETWHLLHAITSTPEDAHTLADAVLKWSEELPESDRSTAAAYQVDLLAATVMTKH
ncbi:MAG: hypothetical protein P8J24_02185 [Arenicellales bacterium]|jgi:hypothetical protein|nr:hypothetical protein [Arenicellales bacterium]